MRKRVSIYVRNSKIDPSGYYRVINILKILKVCLQSIVECLREFFNLNLNINNSLFKKICQIYFLSLYAGKIHLFFR